MQHLGRLLLVNPKTFGTAPSSVLRGNSTKFSNSWVISRRTMLLYFWLCQDCARKCVRNCTENPSRTIIPCLRFCQAFRKPPDVAQNIMRRMTAKGRAARYKKGSTPPPQANRWQARVVPLKLSIYLLTRWVPGTSLRCCDFWQQSATSNNRDEVYWDERFKSLDSVFVE